MNWAGVNKAFGPTEIEPSASPDSVNSFDNGGVLGPRKGKTQTVRIQYIGKMNSVTPFIGPWGTQYIIGDSAGMIKIYVNTDESGYKSPTSQGFTHASAGIVVSSASGITVLPYSSGGSIDSQTQRFFTFRMASATDGFGDGAAGMYVVAGSTVTKISLAGTKGQQELVNITLASTGEATVYFGESASNPLTGHGEMIFPMLENGTITGATVDMTGSAATTASCGFWKAG